MGEMAFTFGRGKTIGRWVRDRPRVFSDWEKIEGVLTPELCDQHKQEEGTPMLLDQATSRNVSRALKEINGFDWEGDFKPMARQPLKELVQKQLEEEMAEYLGLSRYEHALRKDLLRYGAGVRLVIRQGLGKSSFQVAACPQVPERLASKVTPDSRNEVVSPVFSVILVNAKILDLVAENTTGYPESVCSL
jgi:hypothetical protein